MDTTTAIILRVSEFFADLATPIPDFSSKESLEAFKAEQDANFASTLADFQKARTTWARENLKLYQIESSKKSTEESVLAQKAVVAEFRVPFDETFAVFMEARGREEVARALPEAIFGIEEGVVVPHSPSAHFVARQVHTARVYLGLS